MVLRCGSTSCGNKWKKKLHLKNQPGLWPNSVLHLLIHMLWLKLGYTPGYNLKIRPTLKIGYVPLPAVIEQSWLSWLRHNQGKLCVAQLNGIMDAAHAGDHLSNVGQHFIRLQATLVAMEHVPILPGFICHCCCLWAQARPFYYCNFQPPVGGYLGGSTPWADLE